MGEARTCLILLVACESALVRKEFEDFLKRKKDPYFIFNTAERSPGQVDAKQRRAGSKSHFCAFHFISGLSDSVPGLMQGLKHDLNGAVEVNDLLCKSDALRRIVDVMPVLFEKQRKTFHHRADLTRKTLAQEVRRMELVKARIQNCFDLKEEREKGYQWALVHEWLLKDFCKHTRAKLTPHLTASSRDFLEALALIADALRFKAGITALSSRQVCVTAVTVGRPPSNGNGAGSKGSRLFMSDFPSSSRPTKGSYKMCIAFICRWTVVERFVKMDGGEGSFGDYGKLVYVAADFMQQYLRVQPSIDTLPEFPNPSEPKAVLPGDRLVVLLMDPLFNHVFLYQCLKNVVPHLADRDASDGSGSSAVPAVRHGLGQRWLGISVQKHVDGQPLPDFGLLLGDSPSERNEVVEYIKEQCNIE